MEVVEVELAEDEETLEDEVVDVAEDELEELLLVELDVVVDCGVKLTNAVAFMIWAPYSMYPVGQLVQCAVL